MTARVRLAEAQVALMLLTRLPAGRIPGDAPGLGAARWAYPVVGLAVGALAWAAHATALAAGLPPGVAAVLALCAAALATGGLHHDGLADLADGLGGGRDRARVLEIMRDSRIGSYGVLALGLVLGLQGTALAAGGAAGVPLEWFLFAAAGSRLAMAAVQGALPPARPDGLGAAARATGAGALLPGALLAGVLAVWAGSGAATAAILAGAAALWLAGLARKRLGGQTGDALGAVQMLGETAIWLGFAAQT